MAILPYDSVVWTELSLASANKTARTSYNILRGSAGATAQASTGTVTATAPVVPTTPTVPTKPVAGGSYTVQSGDFLGKIAESVFGDATKWSNIYEANRGILKNPNDLQPGQVLTIPAV